ncbi:MAG: hypothetical protein JWN36_413 [Microbacteriaceae bacterium]|nr:hypothetical protein [Microbacteriaceae bacterium]
MADEPQDYRAYAGYVLFPRTPADLTSATTCPACFTVISGPTCSNCGLDLAHPAAAELATLSADAASLLDRRLDLIGRIRYETRQPVPTSDAVPFALANRAPEPPSPFPIPSTVEPDAPEGPQRSAVQVALLVVGITLLSIAAIFFLVYAFITFGLVVRTAIIGAITVAAIVTTIALRRRLPATSEGIAALSVVLVYLDVWAAQANDFFGLALADAGAYWGLALLVTGAVGLAWSRVGGPRAWGITGAAVVGVGFGLVAGWVADHVILGWSAFVFGAALALSGVAQRALARVEERAILVVIAAVGMLLTSIGVPLMATSIASSPGENLLLALVLAGVATANIAAAPRNPLGRSIALAFAGLAAVAPAVVLVGRALFLIYLGLVAPWSHGSTDTLIPAEGRNGAETLAVTCLVALVALAVGVLALARRSSGPLARPFTLAVIGVAVLTLAGGVIQPIAWQQSAWSVIAVATLVGSLALRHRLSLRFRVLAITTVAVNLALAYLVGWASLQTWQGPTLIAIAALLLLRMLVSHPIARAALLVAAAALLIVGAGGGARALALPLRPAPAADAVNAAHATGFISILLLGLAAYVVLARVSRLDRRVVFWLALAVIAVSTAITQTLLPLGLPTRTLLLPEYVTSLVVSLFLIAALASWTASVATSDYPVERAAAVGALPIALALLIDGLARTIGVEPMQRGVAIVIVLSVAHVLASLSALPHRRIAALSSVVVAGIAGLYAFAVGELAPIEWVSVPVGLALIATGAIHMLRAPEARSWAWLAPGVGILLVPSLIATAFDAPLWRLVALGVVGVAIIVIAAVLRLQAPLLIASVVVLIHAIATFAPEIRAVYELVEWWIWIAIGGVIVMVVAIRFEASRRGVTRLVAHIADLR